MRPQRHRKLQRRVTGWPRNLRSIGPRLSLFHASVLNWFRHIPIQRHRGLRQFARSEVSTPVCAQAEATLDRPQHEIYAAWYRLGLRSAGPWHEGHVARTAADRDPTSRLFPFVHLPAAFTEGEWRCLGWLRAPRESSASPSPRASPTQPCGHKSGTFSCGARSGKR